MSDGTEGAGPTRSEDLLLRVGDSEVDARAILPSRVRAVAVLHHGAGSSLGTPLLEGFTAALARHGVASLRSNFPYRQAGRKRPDRADVLHESCARGVEWARRRFPALPIVVGGHSMGGRMASEAVSARVVASVAGIAFLAFPFAGKGERRTEHFERSSVPLWFAHGTRDRLGTREEIEALVQRLGSRATLEIVEGADHSFAVLRRSGRTPQDVHEQLAHSFTDWLEGTVGVAD